MRDIDYRENRETYGGFQHKHLVHTRTQCSPGCRLVGPPERGAVGKICSTTPPSLAHHRISHQIGFMGLPGGTGF